MIKKILAIIAYFSFLCIMRTIDSCTSCSYDKVHIIHHNKGCISHHIQLGDGITTEVVDILAQFYR